LALSQLEDKINSVGRNRKNVLHYRQKYGRMIWHAMKNRCIASLTGQLKGSYTCENGLPPNIWPKGTELHTACEYVVNHFDRLTLYLDRKRLINHISNYFFFKLGSLCELE
jgi:hypothetical protein